MDTQAPRPRVLAELEAERREALGAYEYRRAEEISAQMTQLSAGDGRNPSQETTSRQPAPAARRKR